MHYLIVNPVAGRGFALRARAQVERFFLEQGLPLTVLVTEAPGHATEMTRALPEDARVLSLGGDGTLHEVAVACVGTSRVVGVLPGGTGDDFAMALGLKHHDIDAALKPVLAGRVSQVDTGLVNGQPFFNALGMGFDADVAYSVRHAPRVFKGLSAYLWAILSTLSKLEAVEVEVETGGAPFYRGPALLVAVLNGPRVAASFHFCPEARPDDGEFDVIIAGRFGRLGTLGLLPKVMKGTHLPHPELFTTRATRVRVSWARPRVAHVEGELLSASDTFEIVLCPKNLRVFSSRHQHAAP
jgi:diacylglycerol kinase (ATP)